MSEAIEQSGFETRYRHFVCPMCKTRTAEMNVSDTQWYVSEEDELKLKMLNRSELVDIAHEILLCPCGLELTWFLVMEVSGE